MRFCHFIFGVFSVLNLAHGALAQDFKYANGKCVNNAGVEGLNPNYLGECGDLEGRKLIEMDLSGKNFRGARLVGADFRISDLSGSDFTGANLTGAILYDIDINYAVFDDAVLIGTGINPFRVVTGASFKRVNFTNALISSPRIVDSNFEGSQLEGIRTGSTVFENVVFKGAKMKQVHFGSSLVPESLFSNVDFTDANLEDVKFTTNDLVGVNFSNAALSAVEFKGIKIEKMISSGAVFEAVEFDGVELVDSQLGAEVSSVVFKSTSLQGQDFSNGLLDKAWFIDVDLSGVTFANGVIKDSKFDHCSMTGVNLDGSNFKNTTFVGAIMDSASMVGAVFEQGAMTDGDFSFATGDGMTFDRVSITNVNFASVTMPRMKAVGANLEGVNFEGADLQECDFSNATLKRVNFDDANLFRCSLYNVNGQEASLRRAVLEKADMSKGKFNSARFEEAKLKLAKLKDADLSVANFTNADLKGAYLLGAIFNSDTILPFSDAEAKQRGMVLKTTLEGSFGDTNMNQVITSPTKDFIVTVDAGGVGKVVVEMRAAGCQSDFDDFTILLISPSGTSVTLQNNANGDTTIQARADGVRFGDPADVSVPDLANFVGEPTNGDWIVRFNDDDGDLCNIDNLMLHFEL